MPAPKRNASIVTRTSVYRHGRRNMTKKEYADRWTDDRRAEKGYPQCDRCKKHVAPKADGTPQAHNQLFTDVPCLAPISVLEILDSIKFG